KTPSLASLQAPSARQPSLTLPDRCNQIPPELHLVLQTPFGLLSLFQSARDGHPQLRLSVSSRSPWKNHSVASLPAPSHRPPLPAIQHRPNQITLEISLVVTDQLLIQLRLCLRLRSQWGKPFRSLFEGPISQTTLPDPPTQTRPCPPIVVHKPEVPDPTPLTEPSTTHCVLRTLFLRLSPCRHEGEEAISNSCKDPGGDGLCSSEDQITRGSTSTGQQRQSPEEPESEREEPESEREEPDELLVVPLEPLVPYVPLGDSRHHRQADITLPRSTFARDVVWSFEDLAPLPPPSLKSPAVCPSGLPLY
ncbi:uncharacterized protein, partial [Salvelinus alpinus]|uniref:uncharacterized protein n=1 Tax=Salvelinus alpinus TaxID=8036 RepID=UPI0039FB8E56